MVELFVAALMGLCMIPGVLLRYAPFRAIVSPRRKRLLIAIYVAVSLANVLVMTVLFHVFGLTIATDCIQVDGTVYAFVLALANILLIPNKLREHLFTLGIVVSCQYLMLSIPAYVLSLMPELSGLPRLLVFIGIYGGILLLIHWPFNRLLCSTIEPFLRLNTGNYWNTVFFIPIVYFAAMVTVMWGTDTVDNMIQLSSSLFSGAVMIFICANIGLDHRRLREKQVMEQQLEGQRIHYAELAVRVEEARKTKHDFKHHITAIRHCMDTDDKEGLARYCEELLERVEGRGAIPYTGNAAADGILYHYIQRAQQEHIRFRYSGTIRSQGIADLDLCALLGNALDNALTGCMTIPQGRSITLISQSEEKLLSIVIRNTFDGTVNQSGEKLMSRKQGVNHGIGVASMQSICRHYGGSLDYQWDENTFSVIIILPLT